jgi:pimeloyl-ACP methyl ester carboxylesterase
VDLAKKPQEPKRDPLQDEIDALLKQLPEADPSLEGDRDESSEKAVDDMQDDVAADSAASTEPTRRDRIWVWVRVGLAIVLGGAITQWPHLSECGLPLFGLLAALLAVGLVGLWASVWAWKIRMGVAHLLGLAVLAWGITLIVGQVLPRIGYAESPAAWSCPEPEPVPLVRADGGFLRRPDGTFLRYEELGSSPPTVIAAGAMMLTDVLSPLAQQHGMVLYDPRRRGPSHSPSDTLGVGIDVEVDDLAAVRQYFAAESLAVVGWAHTAATVARYAALRRDIVTRVILIGAIPPRRSSYEMDWSRGLGHDTLGLELLRILRIRGEDQSDQENFCSRYWKTAVLWPWLGDSTALDRVDVDFCRFDNEQPDRREATIARLEEAFGDWDWTGAVAEYAGPVLVIHGTADPYPIEGAEDWVQSFPNARLLSVEGAGHLPWLEQPDVVHGAIETFMGGRWPSGVVRDSVQ